MLCLMFIGRLLWFFSQLVQDGFLSLVVPILNHCQYYWNDVLFSYAVVLHEFSSVCNHDHY